MDKCFLVISEDCSENGKPDLYYEVFSTFKKARSNIEKESEYVVSGLMEQGYPVKKVENSEELITVYVENSDIYYSWEIIPLDIK